MNSYLKAFNADKYIDRHIIKKNFNQQEIIKDIMKKTKLIIQEKYDAVENEEDYVL